MVALGTYSYRFFDKESTQGDMSEASFRFPGKMTAFGIKIG